MSDETQNEIWESVTLELEVVAKNALDFVHDQGTSVTMTFARFLSLVDKRR